MSTNFPILVIAYHEDSGEIIGGTVLVGATDDRNAVAKALDWVAGDAPAEVGGWQAFEILDSWGPGREIKPIDSDYR